MLVLAVALKGDKQKRYSQAKVAAMMGVARETVRDWLADIPNDKSVNASKPDARIKLNKAAKDDVVARVKDEQSKRWQKVASIPDALFEQYLSTATDITTAGALRLAAKATQAIAHLLYLS